MVTKYLYFLPMHLVLHETYFQNLFKILKHVKLWKKQFWLKSLTTRKNYSVQNKIWVLFYLSTIQCICVPIFFCIQIHRLLVLQKLRKTSVYWLLSAKKCFSGLRTTPKVHPLENYFLSISKWIGTQIRNWSTKQPQIICRKQTPNNTNTIQYWKDGVVN